MLRVESILKALKSGQGYPVYIYQTMLEGYGYGMGIFYPDLFLLPAVLFRLLGASPEIAISRISILFFFFSLTQNLLPVVKALPHHPRQSVRINIKTNGDRYGIYSHLSPYSQSSKTVYDSCTSVLFLLVYHRI